MQKAPVFRGLFCLQYRHCEEPKATRQSIFWHVWLKMDGARFARNDESRASAAMTKQKRALAMRGPFVVQMF